MEIQLFYEEPDVDRWLPLDRYPRRLVRRLRNNSQPSGHKRVFFNLCAGLQRLGIAYRINQFSYIKRHPEKTACIIGKPHLLNRLPWQNPIVFGAAIYSHPVDDPDLLNRLPIKKILVPGEWMRKMCEPFWGDKVKAWPVGIDTYKWGTSNTEKDIDLLIYDKVMWNHKDHEIDLIQPIMNLLRQKQLKTQIIRYGFYKEEDFFSLLGRSKGMIFLCEHETQGIAYQQALSRGVPILAWDRGGFWLDPSYYPHKVRFAPVTSVPYWDEHCGIKFEKIDDFPTRLEIFLDKLYSGWFAPRDYILENLTLEKCARHYIEILEGA